MKKSIITFIVILILNIFMMGCSSASSNLSKSEETRVKDTVDLVLSYKNGYDDTMKKHISEKNFYVCNYVEFYSIYIGSLDLKKYESNIISIRNDNGRYVVCMSINMEAKALETHGDEKLSDEVIGEDVPIEVILKERNGELYIEGFTEYESLGKAKELNEGFKQNNYKKE